MEGSDTEGWGVGTGSGRLVKAKSASEDRKEQHGNWGRKPGACGTQWPGRREQPSLGLLMAPELVLRPGPWIQQHRDIIGELSKASFAGRWHLKCGGQMAGENQTVWDAGSSWSFTEQMWDRKWWWGQGLSDRMGAIPAYLQRGKRVGVARERKKEQS